MLPAIRTQANEKRKTYNVFIQTLLLFPAHLSALLLDQFLFDLALAFLVLALLRRQDLERVRIFHIVILVAVFAASLLASRKDLMFALPRHEFRHRGALMRGFVFGVFSCGSEFFWSMSNCVEGGQQSRAWIRFGRGGVTETERKKKGRGLRKGSASFEVTINYLVSSKQTGNFGGDLGTILGPALSGL